MADNYLNYTGLGYYHSRVKTIFASQTALNALSDRVDDIVAEGGEPNVIEVVQKNGTALPVSSKTVNVTVPTATSDLTNDGDGQSNFATESYVNLNGGKIDVIQVNGTAQTITNKTVDIAVPTATSDLTNDSNFVADANYVHTDSNYTAAEKSKLSGIASGAEVNVQADWNVTTTTSDAFIKNKPSIPSKTSDLTNDSNFVSDASYVHTDNNYTSTEKTKLSGIAAGAEVNVQADWNVTTTTSDAYIKNKPSLATVATSGAYGDLSGTPSLATVATSGAYSDLSGKPSIPTKTSDLTNDSGYQTASDVSGSITTALANGGDAYQTASDVSTAISTAVSSAYIYKGSVATVSDLPASGNTTGDVYDVQSTGVNYAWNGTAWDALGSYVDTSLYWAKSELTALTTAQIDAIIAA